MFTLTIEPQDALIDVPREIVVKGAEPGGLVKISATTVRQGVRWIGYGEYHADLQGTLQLSCAEPLEDTDSTYDKASSMGLIWSQIPQVEHARQIFNFSVFDPLLTNITASSEGSRASESMLQRIAAQGVRRVEIEEKGVVGTLFIPAGEGPFPAVVVMGSSEGGVNEPRAALLASYGYMALTLGYFKVPGRSEYISNTPIEYFISAVHWLRETQEVAKNFVALCGYGRGAEAALLTAASFPLEVSAVIAYGASAFVNGAQCAADPVDGRDGPAWTVDGRAPSYLWQNNEQASWDPYETDSSPKRHRLAMETALHDHEAMKASRIPVEKIRAPILLISGDRDDIWPASQFCQMIVDRLEKHQFAYGLEWVDVSGAGHGISFPYTPTSQSNFYHPVSKMLNAMGGNAFDNAEANVQAWKAVKHFLAQYT